MISETDMQAPASEILLTGGTGLVGSHLAELLVSRGYGVRCLVRNPRRPGWLETAGGVRIVEGDCLSPASLQNAVKGVDLVIHAAGLTKAVRTRHYYEVNHRGTKNLLEACLTHGRGIRKFVLVSSQAAVGPGGNNQPVHDASEPHPVSDYGKSKLLAEQEALRQQSRLSVVIVRPSAIYGPRDRDMFQVFQWAARGVFLKISGEERFLNLCYVADCAEALLLAAEQPTASGSIYYAAESRPYSWTEFRDLLLAAGGKRARTVVLPYPAAYMMGALADVAAFTTGKALITSRQKIREAAQTYWTCDLTKTERELGFRAGHQLASGLAITWKWYRDQGWL